MWLFDWFRDLFDDDEPEWDGVIIDLRNRPEPVDINPYDGLTVREWAEQHDAAVAAENDGLREYYDALGDGGDDWM